MIKRSGFITVKLGALSNSGGFYKFKPEDVITLTEHGAQTIVVFKNFFPAGDIIKRFKQTNIFSIGMSLYISIEADRFPWDMESNTLKRVCAIRADHDLQTLQQAIKLAETGTTVDLVSGPDILPMCAQHLTAEALKAILVAPDLKTAAIALGQNAAGREVISAAMIALDDAMNVPNP